jgi:hypothetical protein
MWPLLVLLLAPIPKPEALGTVAIVKNSPLPVEVIVVRTDGKLLNRFALNGLDGPVASIGISPNGRQAIVRCRKELKDGDEIDGIVVPPLSLWHIPLDEAKPRPRKLGPPAVDGWCQWKDDATLIVRHRVPVDPNAAEKTWRWKSQRLILATTEFVPFDLPADRHFVNVSADGAKAMMYRSTPPGPKTVDVTYDAGFVDLATGKVSPWLVGNIKPLRLSADGTLVAGVRLDPDRKNGDHVVVDVATKAVVSKWRIVEGADRRWFPGRIVFDGNRAVGGSLETLPLTPDSDRGWCYSVGTLDRASKSRKIYFTTEANETIVAFDVR